jgi:hypothetical protein
MDIPGGWPVNPTAKPAPSELPAPFGRYRLVKLLGQGGMGGVYLAQDTQLDRLVALKIPLLDANEGSQILARFYREARAAAALHHPNICPIHDVGDRDGLPYLTMAYIEGKPLSEFTRLQPLLPRQSAVLVRKLALALHEAHKRNVIHRDLKPANIMIDQRGEPVIMDFGLAHRARKGDARLTQVGSILGSPAYMAPEQVSGNVDAPGPAIDIYSLGVILYELLARRLPFRGDMMAILSQVVLDEPPPPSQFRADLEPELEAICLKAMAKKIEDRYASMADLATALSEYLRNKSVPPAKPKPAPDLDAKTQAETPSHAEWAALTEHDVLRPRQRPKAAGRGVPLWAWLGGAGAALVLLLVWLIYRATDYGTIRIEVAPAGAQAEIEINGEGGHRPGEELKLPAGVHRLTVLAGRFEPKHRPLTIHRGRNEKVLVTLRPTPDKQPAPLRLLFDADFKKDANQFGTGENDIVKVEHDKGQYRVRNKSAGGLWWFGQPIQNLELSDFVCEVDAEFVKETGTGGWVLGLIRSKPPTLPWTGMFMNQSGQVRIRLLDEGKDPEDLIPLTPPTEAMRPVTERNRVRVEVKDKLMQVFVNGQKVAEQRVERLLPLCGLTLTVFADSTPVEVRFNRIRVWDTSKR